MSKLCRVLKVKVIPLILAVVLIFNAAAPSYAQLLPIKNKEQEEKIGSMLQQKHDDVSHYWQTDFIKDITDMKKAVARAKEIKDIFNPVNSAKEEEPADPTPISKKDFSTQYKREVSAAYSAAFAKLETEKERALAALSVLEVEDLASQKDAVDAWESQNIAALQNWKAAIIGEESSAYSRYLEEFAAALQSAKDQQEAETEKYVKALAEELMAIYKKYPGPITELILLEVSPAILMLKKGKVDFFTQADKAVLKKLYLKNLKSSDSCDIVVVKKTTTFTNVVSPTVGAVSIPHTHKEYGVKSKEGCDALLNAVVGIGIIGDGSDDALAVVEFMEKNARSGISVPSMLMGASALMAMKQYPALRGFIASAVSKENNDISSFPSLTDLVDIIAYNRTYLGEVSQYTKYPIGNGAMGNGWEDIAYLLAEDNTTESLEILKSFAIKCSVFPGDRFVADRLTCTGIRPFLAGAVLSGKIDFKNFEVANIAEEYNSYYMQSGRVMTLSPEEIQRNKNYNAWARSNFNKYVQDLGVSKGAALAKWIYDSDMGDIDVDSKMAIDMKIYKVYASELSKGNNSEIKYYSKGSPIYEAKKSKRTTVNTIRTVVGVGEIALLVWGLWDIGRLGYKGYKLIRALNKNMKLVRAGASVAERTTMLRNMGVARNLVKMRSASRAVSSGARFATGVKMPAISADSFITGMAKPVMQLSSLPKAVAPVVLADLAATGVVGRALLPTKRTYQEIYFSRTGRDPFAIKGFGAQNSGVSPFNGARLFGKSGKELPYSTLEINNDDLLVVDGVVQKIWKASIEQKEFASFVSSARKQGYTDIIEMKAALPGAKRTPIAAFKDKFFTVKENQYGINLEVVDNLGKPMNARLMFDSSYGIHKGLIGSKQIMFKGGRFMHEGKPLDLNIGVPKNQVITMSKQGVNFTKMPPLDIVYGKSKMGPLYLNMAMSFSAASGGLLYPLTNAPYKGNVSEFEVSLITIGLPYGFSMLAPFASGVVSKLGAYKTQMLAMSIAAGGLGVASMAGYWGQSTLMKDEDGNLLHDKDGKVITRTKSLPLWPLYVASGVTGAASALGRASLSVLNKQLEVGNSMLKGMAMKNIGGLAMIIPPAAVSLLGGDVDFSIAFPVLAGVSVGTVVWMKAIKYSDNINKIPGFKYNFAEAARSFKIMGNASVLPYVGAYALYAGYEGQALWKSAAALSKDAMAKTTFAQKEATQQNMVALTAGVALAIVPGLTRWFAPKGVTDYGPNILKAVTASGIGGALLYTQDKGINEYGWLGAGLVGYGVANMYIFMQKAMLTRLKKNYLANPQKFSIVKDGVSIVRPYQQIETEALTAYTGANMGLALGQQLTSAYADHRKAEYKESSQEANRQSLWIPGVMLVGGTAIAAGAKIIKMPKLTIPKTFSSFTLPMGAVGLPYAAYLSTQIGSGNYPFKPAATPALKVPVFEDAVMPPAREPLKVDLQPAKIEQPEMEADTQQDN